jgi:hypothetical protein
VAPAIKKSLPGEPVNRFVFVSFIFMGWAYYELSGGGDFVAESWPDASETVADARISTSSEPAAEGTDQTAEAIAALTVATVATPDVATAETEVAQSDVDPALGDPTEGQAEPTFVSLVAPGATAPAATETAAGNFRSVDANRLNVRQGPSTTDGVVGQITRGEIVAVLEETSDGWSLISIEGDGIQGWVASRFLVQ